MARGEARKEVTPEARGENIFRGVAPVRTAGLGFGAHRSDAKRVDFGVKYTEHFPNNQLKRVPLILRDSVRRAAQGSCAGE